MCIKGAAGFSPRYMHSAAYLRTVLGLEATWYIMIDPHFELYAGMALGSRMSRGDTVLIGAKDTSDTPRQSALRITVQRRGIAKWPHRAF